VSNGSPTPSAAWRGMIRHDNALHQHVQFEPCVAIACNISHQLHSLVDLRHSPSCNVWYRTTAAEGDYGKTHDVGLPRSEGKKPPVVAANDNGRMRPLDRKGIDCVAGHPIMRASGGDLFTLEQAFDKADSPLPAARP
jgi:hypothetical protein